MPVHLKAAAVGVLRAARAAHSRGAGAILAAAPALEKPFILLGRGLSKRSTIVRGLYWHAQEDLVSRLRGSDRRFRRLPIAGQPIDLDITDGTARLHYFYGEPFRGTAG